MKIHISTNSYKVPLSQRPPPFVNVVFLVRAILTGVVVSPMVLTCIFWWLRMLSIFHVPDGSVSVLFCILIVLLYILTLVYELFVYFVYILYINCLSIIICKYYIICKYFLSLSRSSFHLSKVFTPMQNLLTKLDIS